MTDPDLGSTQWISNTESRIASAGGSRSTCRLRLVPIVDAWSRLFHARRPGCGECRLAITSSTNLAPLQSHSPPDAVFHHGWGLDTSSIVPRKLERMPSGRSRTEEQRQSCGMVSPGVFSADRPLRPTVNASPSWCRDVD